jgi:hypothetical protein
MNNYIYIYIYIYIYGQPLDNPKPRGCVEADGLTARRLVRLPAVARGGTLISHKCHPGGPLMGRVKPHVGVGHQAQVTIIQHKSGIILTPQQFQL